MRDHDKRFDKIDGDLDYLRRDVRGLRSDMAKIVGDAMREANAKKPARRS